MREIIQDVPGVEALLDLEPEEFAGKILRALIQRGARDRNEHSFSRHNLAGEFLLDGPRDPSYRADRRQEAQQAFIEAFVWLEVNGLVVPQAGNETWHIVGRRGHRVAEEEAFAHFVSAQHFPKQLIHADIQEQTWSLFIRGQYADAVFHAMRAVEIRVRERSGLDPREHGVSLMRKAFHQTHGPLADQNVVEGEREALMNLFAGAIGSYKNPHSHRTVELTDPVEAIEMIMLASHLLKIVDERQA